MQELMKIAHLNIAPDIRILDTILDPEFTRRCT